MTKSRTVARPLGVESPRHLPLVDLLVDARTELFELAVRSGLKVLETVLEEDRVAVCGPRYAHVPERRASRAGTVTSDVVLGGRKVAVRRPRVRADGREVPLPTFQAMADVDPLNRGSSSRCSWGSPPAATRAAWSPCRRRCGAGARARARSAAASSRRRPRSWPRGRPPRSVTER